MSTLVDLILSNPTEKPNHSVFHLTLCPVVLCRILCSLSITNYITSCMCSLTDSNYIPRHTLLPCLGYSFTLPTAFQDKLLLSEPSESVLGAAGG